MRDGVVATSEGGGKNADAAVAHVTTPRNTAATFMGFNECLNEAIAKSSNSKIRDLGVVKIPNLGLGFFYSAFLDELFVF